MNRIEINGRNGLSAIYLNNGIFRNAAEMCIEKFNMNKVHIITDDNLEDLYLDKLISDFAELVYSELEPEDAQEDFDFEISYSVIPAGEDSKNLGTVADIYDSLADAEISRNDLIIALGGGVVGDIAGFAASTYLRGVRFCQIPTTLLSQVDSSVGGKCGINLPQGKNLVGSFFQPDLVIIDPNLLCTLSEEVFCDGMAEVIKYGFISKPDIIEMIEDYHQGEMLGEKNSDIIMNIINECIHIKKAFVENDELDKGMRNILNFGHTIGHAIEKLSGYENITHGQAIAMGMVCETKMFSGDNKEKILRKLIKTLEMYGLPTELPYGSDEIFQAVKSDKKVDSKFIKIIVLDEIGSAEIIKMEMEEFMERLEAVI